MGDLTILKDAQRHPRYAQASHLFCDVSIDGGEIRLALQRRAGVDVSNGQHKHQGQAN
jgi:hypothetical protein